MALGTGFGTLFRGVGMSLLELAAFPMLMYPTRRPSWRSGNIISYFPIQTHTRASHTDNRSKCRGGKLSRLFSWNFPWCTTQLITRIKQQSNLVVSLPPDVQRAVRDAHSTSIKAVFVYAACLTLVSYAVRLAVSVNNLSILFVSHFWPSVIDTREGTWFAPKHRWASRGFPPSWWWIRTRRERGIVRNRCSRGEGRGWTEARNISEGCKYSIRPWQGEEGRFWIWICEVLMNAFFFWGHH